MPVWFKIKVKNKFTGGSIHVYRVIESSQYLPDIMKQSVDPVIERNVFFAYHENLFVGMVFNQ